MKRLLALSLCGLVLGCAKFPSGGGPNAGKRLIFTMTLDREVNPNYVYIIALNPSNDLNPTVTGPVPVVGPPWGNGFVAGTVKYFVRWDPLTSPNYILYKFQDENLIGYFQIGVPVDYQDVPEGGKVLHFSLDERQIADSADVVDQLQSLQVNFLTMDKVPTGTTPVNKALDAIGNTSLPSEINNWITVPLRNTGVYDNARLGNIEPTGDVQDPDLDIADFSVEVRDQ